MDYETLVMRSQLVRDTRAFFDRRNYLEVITPSLSPDLIPESCLEVFETTLLPPANSKIFHAKKYYLVPSPEIWMKKIIAEYKKSIYQICPSFRNCESTGRMHNPEFMMLEYYTMDANYIDSLSLTEELCDTLITNNKQELLRFQSAAALTAAAPPFVRLSMDDAFKRYAGFSLKDALAGSTLRIEAERLGMNIAPEFSEADIYNLIFIDKVEPSLPREKPVALLDYPAIVPALAQKKDSKGLWLERWELYIRGIETANCYSEETNAENVRRYFERESAEKSHNAVIPHAVDADYWHIFAKNGGFPRCSGVAIGMDRLIMALTGKNAITATLSFPMNRDEESS
ncbi:MAG: LysR family transcriptional regulator [Spirochaetaceae bacterium]|nr:LysR family transcriptional regulator [Spirochaetaceae bacterium]